MTTERCTECEYRIDGIEVSCVNCGGPLTLDLESGEDLTDMGEIAGVIRVTNRETDEEFEFKVTLEDGGIMLATSYDYHWDDARDPDRRNEDAWAAMDAALGLDARGVAVDKGVGADWPPFLVHTAVSFTVIPYEMALLIRNTLGRR